jgi:hypothetical protein
MSAIYGQKLHVTSADRKNKSPFCAGPAGGRPQRAAEPGRVRRGVRALLGYGGRPKYPDTSFTPLWQRGAGGISEHDGQAPPLTPLYERGERTDKTSVQVHSCGHDAQCACAGAVLADAGVPLGRDGGTRGGVRGYARTPRASAAAGTAIRCVAIWRCTTVRMVPVSLSWPGQLPEPLWICYKRHQATDCRSADIVKG